MFLLLFGFVVFAGAAAQDCGIVSPDTKLVVTGPTSRRGEVPWHALIYTKTTKPNTQICAGSLISRNVVLSGATCFWSSSDDVLLPASQFAVAVGKVHRPWSDPKDDAQRSDIKEIAIPLRFQGMNANYQDNLAVLVVSKPFVYNTYVQPVCISFESHLSGRSLSTGDTGKIAGWDCEKPTVLQVKELKFLDVTNCMNESPRDFIKYITSDKMCAKTTPKSALCGGDGGGGFTFVKLGREYLVGIASTAPSSDLAFSTEESIVTFTEITSHEQLIRQYWPKISANKTRLL